jgi:hypothetical protein
MADHDERPPELQFLTCAVFMEKPRDAASFLEATNARVLLERFQISQ